MSALGCIFEFDRVAVTFKGWLFSLRWTCKLTRLSKYADCIVATRVVQPVAIKLYFRENIDCERP
jgi:hypothetical protein